METYWSLRWLQQEHAADTEAVVLKENLVRFSGLPLTTRVPSLPDVPPGTRVRLELKDLDLFERTVGCVYRETLGPAVVAENSEAGTSQKA